MSEVTIITCIKNRPKEMLEKYLQALSEHEYEHDLILVDYGSTPENLIWERELMGKYRGKLIEVTRNTDVFSSGRSLNIGIKASVTPYIITTDADVLIPEVNVKKTVELLKENPRRIIFSQRWDLKENGERDRLHGKSAYGAFMGMTKEWITKIGGIDETYTNWGTFDTDIMLRASQDGLEEIWVSDLTREHLQHMWHPTSNKSTLAQNMAYHRLKKPIVRNLEGWGEL